MFLVNYYVAVKSAFRGDNPITLGPPCTLCKIRTGHYVAIGISGYQDLFYTHSGQTSISSKWTAMVDDVVSSEAEVLPS